ICVQESDRENDRDGDTGWINGTAECAKRIREYAHPTDAELLEMLDEAGANAAKAALAQQPAAVDGPDAQAAEVEALRAEVERLEDESQSRLEACGDAVSKLCAAEARAERLAEALAGLITWIPSADTYRRLGFDPEAPMRALEEARAALGREAGND